VDRCPGQPCHPNSRQIVPDEMELQFVILYTLPLMC
jgi:hypothetical protein